LSNNLNVLLVTNSETEMSAASMNVAVGAWQDPRHFQGLAHFVEHLLFMGSEKYQREDAFSNLIQQGDG
jgi:secreted Zn-dependent insulinase-like peptidase